MPLNMHLLFPKGTAGYGIIVNPDLEERIQNAHNDGLVMIHRTNDLFEVIWVELENWVHLSRLAKKHFPEAKVVQLI